MTNFLADIPDMWMLLSIVQQHPHGIDCWKLARIATGREATTGVINEIRNRMLPHQDAGRMSAISDGVGGTVYKMKTPATESHIT